MAFRKLKAAEIECRVSTVSEKGCSLLLYKDARVDQNLLDETYGIFGWQRRHELIDGQLFCTVSVRNPETGEWVSKQDVGTESYTEKEKGRASDSFKRACFNIGIGRELYTAPFIWVKAGDCEITTKNGKPTTYDRFRVKDIGYDENGNIDKLVIVNAKSNRVVFENGKSSKPKEQDKVVDKRKIEGLKKQCDNDGVSVATILDKWHIETLEQMTETQFSYVLSNWSKEFKSNG